MAILAGLHGEQYVGLRGPTSGLVGTFCRCQTAAQLHGLWMDGITNDIKRGQCSVVVAAAALLTCDTTSTGTMTNCEHRLAVPPATNDLAAAGSTGSRFSLPDS